MVFSQDSISLPFLCLRVQLKLNFLYMFYSHRKNDGVSLRIQLEILTL